MVKRCAHGLCKSDTRYPNSLAGEVVFFPFPKPKTQYERCLKWIEQCGRPHSQLNVQKINKHTYICSKHFVNGKPTPEHPNPARAVLAPNQPGGCRKTSKQRRSLRVQESPTSSTDDAEETQQLVVDRESPKPPPLPGSQLKTEPEEEQSTEKEKRLEEEKDNMKLKLSLKETEIERLKAQISTLKKRTLTPELLESSQIPDMMGYSTGFTYEQFNQLCKIFGFPNDPRNTQTNVLLNYKCSDWQVAEMPLRSQLLFVLMKLRNNEDLKSLAFRFNINMQTASDIFNSCIRYMFDVLGELPIWPHRDVIAQNMPKTHKADHPSTFAIFVCTELKAERPTSLDQSTNSLKSLVVCDPRGAVLFSSALFAGSTSDEEVVRQCGILPLLEKLIETGYLQRGDGVMAGEGFSVEEEMRELGLRLNPAPFSRSETRTTAGDEPVKHGVHVQRAIAKIKQFKIVSDSIPDTRLEIINHIWYVVSMLSNFQPHILE
ncbi:uncharacterized protein LOC125019909 [Mugil cephalus]|uniref:uncharacterized protein LOC125019909 n=1 Tax=Mugil cephalus TaxID=48193 RepID=UPI001FB6F06F|nr:uncharacterized protein LOC125019909 [Mugil cephalus]